MVPGRTCQGDLVPGWLKGKGGWGVVVMFGNEGLVFVLGMLFLGVYLTWGVVFG